MKILQIIHTSQKRGAEIFTCQLSNHLLNEGHSVKIISVFKGNANLPFKGQITSLEASGKRRFFDYKAWKSLARIIRKYQPDVIQTNAGDTLKYAVFSKIIFDWNTPIIVRNASMVSQYINNFAVKLYNRWLYSKVDKIISVSGRSSRDLINLYPQVQSKIKVIPIGIETKKINKIKLAGSSSTSFDIIHVGGFTFEKNHTGLLGIFKMVLEKWPSAHLHLVGDGILRPEVETLARNMNLYDHITFYGYVENPMDYISASDVLVLPSIIEGLPGVILESMFCNTTVVAYDVGGISEILNPQTGFIIPPGNEKQFAESICENRHPDPLILNNAYKKVTSGFLNSQIAKLFLETYQNAQ